MLTEGSSSDGCEDTIVDKRSRYNFTFGDFDITSGLTKEKKTDYDV